MNKPHIKPIDYGLINSIQYKIIRELHEGEKTVDELSDILAKKTADEIIQKLNQGKTNIIDLADALVNIRSITSLGINKLTHRGFICGESGGLSEDKYLLSENGRKLYQDVYE